MGSLGPPGMNSRGHGGGSLRRGWRAERLAQGSARAVRSGCQTWLLAGSTVAKAKQQELSKVPPLLLTTTWKTLCENMFCVPLPSLNPSLGTHTGLFLILGANAARAVWELPLLSLLFSRFAYVL